MESKTVVLAPAGSEGDVYPMRVFAQALRARGHQVIVCAPPFARNLFSEFLFYEMGSDVKTWTRGRSLYQRDISFYQDEFSFLRKDIELQFKTLSGVSPDCIFSGGYNYAAGSIAEARGIPHIHVFHTPNVFPGSSYPPMMVPWQRLPQVANRFCWLLYCHWQNRIFREVLNRERKSLGLSSVRDIWEYFTTSALLAVDPVFYTGPVPQTSYWYDDSDEELPQALLEFIAAGPPPVYFGLGSMPTGERERVHSILREFVRQSGARLIVSQGWAELDLGADEQVFVIGRVSHAKLFPLLDLVIHHGGSGTVHAAARAGRPQILIPHILDQFFWGERLYQLGVAPPAIHRKHLSPDKLLQAYRAIKETKAFHHQAEALAKQLPLLSGVEEMFSEVLQKRLGINL